MSFLPKKIDDFVTEKIHDSGKGPLRRFKSLLRLLYVLSEGFFDEQISLRAASLVYTTVLSFVPLLAVSFSVLKAFGVNTKLEIMLYYFLEPMGEKGTDISLTVIEFVERMNIGVLGAVGISMLLFTAVSIVSKIESGLNYIWHVTGTRSLSQRFSSYLSILLAGPVLVFTAVSLIVSLKSSYIVKHFLPVSVVGHVAYVAGRISPYVLVSAAFTLVYAFLPNTKVRPRSALAGGCMAGITWGVMGWAFSSFVASSAQYSAIYSGLASLLVFLIWLYWNWLVLLAGARVSFLYQNPGYFAAAKGPSAGERYSERAALEIVALIARNFYSGGKPIGESSLSEGLGIRSATLRVVLPALVRNGVLAATAGESPAFLPARDPESISLKEVVESVRAGDESGAYSRTERNLAVAVQDIFKRIDAAVAESLAAATVKDLVRAIERDGGADPS